MAVPHGPPEEIVLDNGPEFTSKAMRNGYGESFNGKFRDECLNENWVVGLAEARRLVEIWRRHHNEERPHSGLGYQTPAAFAAKRRGGVFRSPPAPSGRHPVASVPARTRRL